MERIIRTNNENADFIALVKALDLHLKILDGDDHAFYAQFNKMAALKYAVVIYLDDVPVGCGALKPFEEDSMEVKRMYVLPEYRNQGLATKVLLELEQWARELSYPKCVLETGKRQPDAIRLYEKNGYRRIPNFGQYAQDENSVCFEKAL